MASAGTVTAYLDMDASKFRDELDNAIGGLKVFRSVAKRLAEPIGKGLLAAGGALSAFAIATGVAATETQKLEKSLSAAFSDPKELAAYTKQIEELGSTPPFTEAQFEKLAKQLKTFDKDVGAGLIRVGNAAAATGAPFDTLGEAISTFGVKAEATNQIIEKLNITPQDLVDAGAVFDETGKKLSFVGENAGKAQGALDKLLDDKFAGAMDKVVTNADKLQGNFSILFREIGVGVAEFKEFAAGALLPVVEYLRDLSPETKRNIGIMVGLAGAAALAAGAFLTVGGAIAGIVGAVVTSALGATLGTLALTVLPALVTAFGGLTGVMGLAATGVAGLAAAFPVLVAPATVAIGVLGKFATGIAALQAVSLKGLASAAAAAFGPFIVAVGAIGALAVLLHKTTEAIKSQTQENERLLQIEEDRTLAHHELLKLVGKTTEELQKQGTSAKDVVKGMTTLQEQLEQAREVGNKQLEATLIKRIIELKAVKEELAKAEAGQREEATTVAASGTPEAKKAREEQRKEELKADIDAIELRLAQERISVEESLRLKKEALNDYQAAVLEAAKGEEKGSDFRKAALAEYQSVEERKRQLAIETARVETQARNDAKKEDDGAAEQARKDRLSAELNAIEILRLEGKISEAQEIARLQRVLKEFELTEQEKRNLRKQTAQKAAKIRDEADKAELSSIEDARKDKIADELADIQTRRDANEITAQQEIEAIERVATTFKTTEDEKRALLLKTSGLRKQLNEQAKKDANDLARAKEKAADLETRALDRQIDELQEKTEETGQDNTAKIREAIEEQLRLQIEAIQLEAEKAAAATKSAEARAQIEKNAQAEIQAAILATADREEEAVQRQIDARERLNKRGKSESQFGAVYDISELGERVKQEQQTTSRFRSASSQQAAGGFSNLQNLAAEITNAQPYSRARSDTGDFIRNIEPTRVEGAIDVKVTFDDEGRPRVEEVSSSGPSLDGRQSSIVRAGRGMKASVGVGA
jgi:hypothetical protein